MMGLSSLTDKQELKDQITRLKTRNAEIEDAIEKVRSVILSTDHADEPNLKLFDIVEVIKKVL